MKKLFSVVLAVMLVASLVFTISAAVNDKTPWLKLGLSDELDAEVVNANFAAIDEELASRGVTPDMFKEEGAEDDTEAVQAAFDSGKTVIFNRHYDVKSVTIAGQGQVIDFNGYWLGGVASEEDDAADKEAILKITGSDLKLYNIQVIGCSMTGLGGPGVNTQYESAVKWYSEDAAHPSKGNSITNLTVYRTKVGIAYGADIDDPNPEEIAMTGNTIYGYVCRSVQQTLNSNQPGGTLNIIGGSMDCNMSEWVLHKMTLPEEQQLTYDTEYHQNAYVFNNKNTKLTLDNLELLKVASDLGYSFIGRDFYLSNVGMEIAASMLIEGDATIDCTDCGYFGGDQFNGRAVFQVAPGSEGRLLIQKYYNHRYPGMNFATTSNVTIVGGLDQAPAFSVLLENCKMEEWSGDMIAPEGQRAQVKVKNCYFTDGAAHDVVDDGGAGDVEVVAEAKQNLLVGVDTTGQNVSTVRDYHTDKNGYTMIWTNVGDGYLVKNTEDVPTGFHSSIELGIANGAGFCYSPLFEVTPGTELKFSAWVKFSDTCTVSSMVGFQFRTGQNVADAYWLGTTPVISCTDEVKGEWQKVSLTVTVPEGAKYANLQIMTELGSTFITGMELEYTDAPQNPAYTNSFINDLNTALDAPGSGMIFTAANGVQYKITVADDGTLVATALNP